MPCSNSSDVAFGADRCATLSLHPQTDSLSLKKSALFHRSRAKHQRLSLTQITEGRIRIHRGQSTPPYCYHGGMVKTRVLVVDDDPNLSRLTGMILENSGEYEVLTENDSRRAISVARQFKPQIMLFDVDMPNKDGGELAREAKNDPQLRDVPVLFLTGLMSKAEAGNQEVECGGQSFLAKPVLPEVLLSSVRKMASLLHLA